MDETLTRYDVISGNDVTCFSMHKYALIVVSRSQLVKYCRVLEVCDVDR